MITHGFLIGYNIVYNFKQFFYLICEDVQFNVPNTLFDKLVLFHKMEYYRYKVKDLYIISRMIEKTIDPTIRKLYDNFYPIFISALDENVSDLLNKGWRALHRA